MANKPLAVFIRQNSRATMAQLALACMAAMELAPVEVVSILAIRGAIIVGMKAEKKTEDNQK